MKLQQEVVEYNENIQKDSSILKKLSGVNFIASSVSKDGNNNHLDIAYNIVNLKGGTAILLFWGVETSHQCGKHQPLIWCNPRFNVRGDNSVYNRLFAFVELKTIMTVIGGFSNSPIAKASSNSSKFNTFFGNQNIGSLVIVNCFRPFCLNIQGGLDV